MSKIRTAIFGGSFDPIHKGHIFLARTILEKNFADEVWFLVTPLNPHKQNSNLSDEKERYEMVKIALQDEERLYPSDFEFGLTRPSYTINTLNALEKTYPDREFVLLMGADNWEKIDKWYKSDEILSRFGIIVYPRGNKSLPLLPPNVMYIDSQLYDISSTEIRKRLSKGEDISYWLHPTVISHIEKNNLYR